MEGEIGMKIDGTVLTRREDVKTDPYIFASTKHMGQLYGDKPYMYHVEEVFITVYHVMTKHFHYDPLDDEDAHVFLIAALLHDVVEDCYDDRAAGIAEVTELFGHEVGEVVDYLTDLEAPTRKLRKEKFLARMSGIRTTADIRFIALVVKLADRLANMRAGIWEERTDKLTMYLKEMPFFMRLTSDIRHFALVSPLVADLRVVIKDAEKLTGYEP